MSENTNRRGNPLAVMAFALAAISVALAIATTMFARSTLTQYEAQLEELTSQNEALRQELESIEIPVVTEPPIQQDLEAWMLDGIAWDDAQGAHLYFQMTPSVYEEGMSATFIVQLDGETAANVPCQWNGSAFTATASLPALNGYVYVCSLDGKVFPLSSTNMWAVNLADSLHGYSSLVIQNWTAEAQTLRLDACYAQVCLPTLLADGGEAECQTLRLTLRLNGEVLETAALTAEAGEESHILEVAAETIDFSLPSLSEGDSLEIWLEAKLSDGRVMESCGGSWYISDGQLQMMAG